LPIPFFSSSVMTSSRLSESELFRTIIRGTRGFRPKLFRLLRGRPPISGWSRRREAPIESQRHKVVPNAGLASSTSCIPCHQVKGLVPNAGSASSTSRIPCHTRPLVVSDAGSAAAHAAPRAMAEIGWLHLQSLRPHMLHPAPHESLAGAKRRLGKKGFC
jgi:hypothetical protein